MTMDSPFRDQLLPTSDNYYVAQTEVVASTRVANLPEHLKPEISLRIFQLILFVNPKGEE